MKTNLLIIGAGPYGISIAALAKKHGLDFLLVGRPMEFWKQHMPDDMLLRSGADWHLDATNINTYEHFISINGASTPGSPIKKSDFVAYCEWFYKQNNLNAIEQLVKTLSYENGCYTALLDDGQTIACNNVVIAVGCQYFAFVPDVASHLPVGRYVHTCDFNEFSNLDNKQYVILGGRQAAFEWASLMAEKECGAITMIYDHDTPSFEWSDWSQVDGWVEKSLATSGWFSGLAEAERESIISRFWELGRLKLEPWLAERLKSPKLTLMPNDNIATITETPDGLEIQTRNGEMIVADKVIFATGYKPDLAAIPFLASGNVLPMLGMDGSFPKLNASFESTLPGLYFASFIATKAFGPFCGFVKGAPMTAEIIVKALVKKEVVNQS